MGRLGTNNSMAGADAFAMAAALDASDPLLHQQSTTVLLGGQPQQESTSMLQNQQHAHSQSVGGESVLNQYQRPGVQQSMDFRNAGVAQSSSVNMLQHHNDSISASQAAGGNLPASSTANAQSHGQFR